MKTIAKCVEDIRRIERAIPPELMSRIAFVVDADTWKLLEQEMVDNNFDIVSLDTNFRNIVIYGVPVVMKCSDDLAVRI